jgi:hypothetical protein
MMTLQRPYGVMHLQSKEQWVLPTEAICRDFASAWSQGEAKFFQWTTPARTTVTIRLSDIYAFEVFQ